MVDLCLPKIRDAESMENSGHTRFIDSKEQGNDINERPDNSEAISQGDGVFNVMGKLSSKRRTLRIIESAVSYYWNYL